MNCKRIYYPESDQVWLDIYVNNSGLKLGQSERRPAIVICPGGGYLYLSPREAEPVALAYAAKGMQAFVLNYSVGWEAEDFKPLKEMEWAVGLVREHADEWQVDEGKIIACGFSAGGHLALAAGLLVKGLVNGMILGYPAADLTMKYTALLAQLLVGKDKPVTGREQWLNLPEQVTQEAPPLFLYCTAEDSLMAAMSAGLTQKYLENGCPIEYHLFGHGPHGYSLANAASANGSSQVMNSHVEKWLDMSVEWLYETFGQPEFKDVSTSRMMEEIKKLGIELPSKEKSDEYGNA